VEICKFDDCSLVKVRAARDRTTKEEFKDRSVWEFRSNKPASLNDNKDERIIYFSVMDYPTMETVAAAHASAEHQAAVEAGAIHDVLDHLKQINPEVFNELMKWIANPK
jgi:hypothetical protein